jgi:hypothetical protein
MARKAKQDSADIETFRTEFQFEENPCSTFTRQKIIHGNEACSL